MFSKNKKNAFTLVELLVVISIIAFLSAVILGVFNDAREKAKIARAKAELREIRNAIALLETDTGKWLFGCRPLVTSDTELLLNNPQSGLMTRPVQGATGDSCGWTSSEVTSWNGSYITTPIDPWGRSYIWDPDYSPRLLCGSPVWQPVNAIVSPGPTVIDPVNDPDGISDYDCDDIYRLLDRQ